MINWLFLFIPVAVGLEFVTPERHILVLATSSLGIIPLAGWLGRATEQLAERLGECVGGFLNATFGNAAELIIALAALRAGLHGCRERVNCRIGCREYPACARCRRQRA